MNPDIDRQCLIVIDIADLAVAQDHDTVFVTYSLGSCLGLTLYDRELRIGGMIHCMLPLSKKDPKKAKSRPLMFTDIGVQQLLTRMFEMGAKRENLVAKLAGCGSPIDDNGRFKIGERNHMVARKILWKNEILISGEDVGGRKPRTMYLELATGRTTLTSRKEVWEI